MRHRSLPWTAGFLLTAALAVVVVDVTSILSAWPAFFSRPAGHHPAEPRALDRAPEPDAPPAVPAAVGHVTRPEPEPSVPPDPLEAAEIAEETADAEGPDSLSKLSPGIARLLEDESLSPETNVRVILQASILWRIESRVAKSVISHEGTIERDLVGSHVHPRRDPKP